MKIFFKLNLWYRSLKVVDKLAMSKNCEKVFYAVGRGRETGIYDSWQECKAQTEGVPNAKYRKFYSYEDAEEFVNFWRSYSTPVRETHLSENFVSKGCGRSSANRRRWTHEQTDYKSKKSYSVPKENKIVKSFLGNETTRHEDYQEGSSYKLPYISPLPSAVNPALVSISGIKNINFSPKAVKPRNLVNTLVSEGDLRMFNGNFPVEIMLSNEEREQLKQKSNDNSQNTFKSSITLPQDSSLDNSSTVSVQGHKPSVTAAENVISSNGSAEMSNELCSEVPCDSSGGSGGGDVSNIVKKEIISMGCGYENVNYQNCEKTAEVSEKLTSCLSMLGSVLNIVMKQNTNVSEKLQNFLESLQGQIINETNTNINPQMEPQGNVDKICEGSNNFARVEPNGIQPTHNSAAQEPTSSETQSSEMPNVGLHPSPSQPVSLEGRIDQKNADVMALNLRLDSFEKRFDACLKEIGGIAAEISNIKWDIKELREILNSPPKSSPSRSAIKPKDGRVQTTLCFDSSNGINTSVRSYSSRGSPSTSEEQGIKEKRSLKRKLSRSNSSEKSKRFADADVDDDLLSTIKTEKVDYTSFTVDEDDYVEVYTDGSALSNGKDKAKAGIGIWFGDNHPLNVSEPVIGPPTNNTAEIQAARVAVQLATKAGITKLKIHTDSQFLINCATKWIQRWKKNGWTLLDGGPVKNKKELEKLDKAVSKISVRWEKVPAHSKVKGNEIADRLANEGAEKYER